VRRGLRRCATPSCSCCGGAIDTAISSRAERPRGASDSDYLGIYRKPRMRALMTNNCWYSKI
jgi:hypothetical protein